MWFQLYSHTALYSDEGGDIAKSTIYSPRTHHFSLRSKDPESSGTLAGEKTKQEDDTNESETPQMTVWMTICLLAIVTVVSCLHIHTIIIIIRIDTFTQLVAVTAEWLVDSISGLTDSGRINKEFVGVILLPIVGNAAGSYTTYIQPNKIHLFDLFRTCNCGDGFCQGQAYSQLRSRSRLEYCKSGRRLFLNRLLTDIQQIALFVVPYVIWE